MKIHPVLTAYFAADQADGSERLQPLFHPDAVVTDEKTRHEGIEAITAWWTAAKAQYGHSTEPLEAEQTGNRHVVRARVTGRFPGSPIVLTYRFRFDEDRIAGLEIG